MFAQTASRCPASKPFRRRACGWLIKEKIPLFFICIVDAGVTLIAQHVTGGAQPFTAVDQDRERDSSPTRATSARHSGPRTWRCTIRIPDGRCTGGRSARRVAGAAGHYGLGGARARHRYLIVGWLWFLIMLVPMIGLVQADVQGMADRYAYDSFIGLFIMVCWGVADFAAERHLPRALCCRPSALSSLALDAAHASSNRVLARQCRVVGAFGEVTHRNWKAEFLLGLVPGRHGPADAAIGHFYSAAQVEKHDPFIDFAIAKYQYTHTNLPAALDYYQKASQDAWNSDQKAGALEDDGRHLYADGR